MECNKEEAIRAKEIAEKKMQNKDFVGARKIVLKAQQLFPDLENISQMLAVCDVHCSAERKVLGSEMDWYGILQIEQTADEVSIKKQYRKFALLLHPDKNKFAGAEAAFKLIGEAQRVLSDQAKRSIYDMKYGAYQRTIAPKQQQQPRQRNKNSCVRKQPGVHNNYVNIGLNPQQQQQQQQTQQGFSNGRQTFWTACPFCNIRYQYYRDILNRALRCQSCMKPFIAYDLDAQGVPLGANCSRSAFPQQKEVPSQGAHKVGPQSTAGNFPSSMGFQGNFGSGATASEPFLKKEGISEVGGGFKTRGGEDGKVDMKVGNEGKKRSKFEEEKHNEGKPPGNMSRKRGRTSEVESSDNCDTGGSSDTDEDGGLPAGQNSGFTRGHHPRRSARQKQNISYNEDLSDNDDFVSPPKRSRGSGLSDATEEQNDEASFEGEASKTKEPAHFTGVFEEDKKMEKEKESAPLKEGLHNGIDEVEERKTNVKEAVDVDSSKKMPKVDNKSKSNLGPKPEPEFFDVPDPDFYDFDKDRKEECFAVDQIWAVYDNADGMPRFYARIRKVFSPGFKVRITWLEANPDDQDEIDWFNEDLPVACGKFKQGKSEDTEDLGMFSHLICWEKGARGSYKIYPRTGETWALFNNWDIKWSSDPDNHRNYEFEFVEVLSDYAEGSGITVAYLGKVKGFVSMFRQTMWKGMVSFQMPPNELFRFSHRVPSFRTTGTEREDVPEGYFELDPASLPDNLKEISNPEDVKVNVESMDAKGNGSCSKSPAEELKPMTGSGRTNTLKKSIDPDEKNTHDIGNSKSGNRSPRKANGGRKQKPSQANLSRCVAEEETGKHLDYVKDSSLDVSAPGKPSASTCQAEAKERNIGAVETCPNIAAESHSPSPASSLEASGVPEPEFYDFNTEKSQEKFQPGQIWALYCVLDELPKYYARIDRIEPPPDFKLHITWLEACAPPKEMIQWFNKDMPICCGTFKLEIDETKVFTDTGSFSHQVRAEPTGKKKKYEIYPRKGEVWALYKNFNSEWTCSDLKKCEYDVVEVLEDNGLVRKVLVLEQADGFQTVFKAQRKGGSAVTMEIPVLELLRFSHQVPAFRLTEERGKSLRGCWEVDPASMPVLFFCSN